MKKIKVLIVDDSALIREMFKTMVNSQPDMEVVDTAVDPYDAREKIKRLNPDVLTLDIEMPRMDGLSFLEKIMTLRPMPVVMVSTLTQKGATETIRALELGAIDYVSKPVGNSTSQALEPLQEELIGKLRVAASANVARNTSAKQSDAKVLNFNPPPNVALPFIAIGSSTGGVEALRDIFKVLPANSPPIVMTQHMPQQFTGSFAARLDSLSQVNVSEARDGVRLKPGTAYLAPGNIHMRVKKFGSDFVCKLEIGPAVSGHRPSVDVLFESVAQAAGANAVGVILTGMGKDGAQGMLKMHEAGAYNIGQDERSCVVYGMPKAAHAAGAVHTQLPLTEIAAHMLAYCARERKVSNVG